MSHLIPLGQREDLHLEFKAADALMDPEKIAREVVAMLNADGGSVWLGVREVNGIAVAAEPIPNHDVQKRRLIDFLVDTIEPSPGKNEAALQSVAVEGGEILCINVVPGSPRRPYAFLKKGGRYFWTRVEDRIRPMDREEILTSLRATAPSTDDVERATQELDAERDSFARTVDKRPAEAFWLRIRPVPKLVLDLDALSASDLLIDPALTSNRRIGRNFLLAVASGGRPRFGPNRLSMGKEGVFDFVISPDGSLHFVAPLRTFHAGAEGEAKKPLYWEALFEFPISIFRLLSAMLKDERLWAERPAPTTMYLSSLAIFGIRGWSLRPSSPRLRPSSPAALDWHSYLINKPAELEDLDLLLTPVRISYQDVLNEPDRCGFRLVRQIYAAFGYEIWQMPKDFNQEAGRLILPE